MSRPLTRSGQWSQTTTGISQSAARPTVNVLISYLYLPIPKRQKHEFLAFQEPVDPLFCSRIRIHYWLDRHMVSDWR